LLRLTAAHLRPLTVMCSQQIGMLSGARMRCFPLSSLGALELQQ